MRNGGGGDDRAAADLGPLPGGHHGLSPQQVAESQRERLLAATVELIAERGYGSVPITDIVRRAAVANRVFYVNFAGKEEAFIASFDAIADHLESMIEAALAPEDAWPRKVIGALRVAAEFFESERGLARFCLIAPFTATASIAEHFRERTAVALPHLATGRDFGDGEQLPASTEDSLLGGILSQLARAAAGGDPFAPLLPDLVEFVLAPYLGPEEARRLADTATA